ncbi:hypothetical protein KBZ12_08215 [Cyanobium sp. Cruz CV13-4-11]|uniref:hypothetical protein n=1 Tax=unclassified Cyanobium TaxID=2627006 RepID=UPI0020CB91DC|nr:MULTISPECIES: hypothetical protein [unclassified Cyanobium]MCP9900385.1 hypothetical protein [Cyanobium sp. Cruz CV11-17]MCP9919468.1 hypothetical protein [Cyanobium sp. Cruz CV13-4-11]
MLIYACISSHGFGHGSRTASVLCELAALKPDWRLVLSTGLPEAFLTLSLGEVPFEHRPCRWDVGVIQADALGADPAATLAALQALEVDLPELVEREARWLEAQHQPVLVLADVPPSAALLARRLQVPLVWLASFGWDTIHAPMGPPFQAWAERHRQLYAQGDLLLHCPLSLPMDWGLPEVKLGLTSSRPRQDVERLARELALPPDRERVVLVSFGGLGMAIDPDLLARWPEHVFIGPEPLLATVPNGRCLPAGVRPLDLMPLTGRLITKPGYSSFCEAFSQGVGIHLVHRTGFAEAPVLEEDLRNHGWHRLLSQEAFRRGDWQLDQALEPPRHGPLPVDGAPTAARAIVSLLDGRSALPMGSAFRI